MSIIICFKIKYILDLNKTVYIWLYIMNAEAIIQILRDKTLFHIFFFSPYICVTVLLVFFILSIHCVCVPCRLTSLYMRTHFLGGIALLRFIICKFIEESVLQHYLWQQRNKEFVPVNSASSFWVISRTLSAQVLLKRSNRFLILVELFPNEEMIQLLYGNLEVGIYYFIHKIYERDRDILL